MNISSVSIPTVTPSAPVKPPQAEPKQPDVTNGNAADGTRLPQPTVLPPLPPGQGPRIDLLV